MASGDSGAGWPAGGAADAAVDDDGDLLLADSSARAPVAAAGIVDIWDVAEAAPPHALDGSGDADGDVAMAGASAATSEAAGAGAGSGSSAGGGDGAGGFVSRDERAAREQAAGALTFLVIANDGERRHMMWLTQAKNIFAAQLPKMPREYIARLVYDRRHRSLVIVKGDSRVVGGICYRPFPTQQFAEIAFLAISSSEQVKGYGTRLMNHLKEAVKRDGITHLLTYADNYAIGYFAKQGFSKRVTMAEERWVGYIKDYDGGTLMECVIEPRLDYTHIHATLRAQRERLLGEVRAVHDETRVYPGLSFSPAGMAPLLRGASYDPARGALDVLDAVPGIAEAGWRPSAIMAQQAHERAVLQGQLVDVTARIVAFADSWPFREPVNTRIVPRYAEVVKEPIDLTVIEARAKAGEYATWDQYLADITLMLNNCRTFNASDTEYVSCADKVEAFVRARVSQVLTAVAPPSGSSDSGSGSGSGVAAATAAARGVGTR